MAIFPPRQRPQESSNIGRWLLETNCHTPASGLSPTCHRPIYIGRSVCDLPISDYQTLVYNELTITIHNSSHDVLNCTRSFEVCSLSVGSSSSSWIVSFGSASISSSQLVSCCGRPSCIFHFGAGALPFFLIYTDLRPHIVMLQLLQLWEIKSK